VIAVRLQSLEGRASTRLALVALAGSWTVTGIVLILSIAPSAWAADAHRNLAAARALLDGTFGSAEGYLYSPLAAALTIPALAVPEGAAMVGWLVLKVAIVLVAAGAVTRGLRPPDRLLASVAAIAFLPVLYDLELGNITVLVAAAIAIVAWIPDRWIAGIPLGIILASAPKPQLIPVLLWMAVFRRRALAGALGSAGLGTLVGCVVFGLGPYVEWIRVLGVRPDLNSGNLSLSEMQPFVAIPASLVVVIATVLAMRRGAAPGLVAALVCGLLVSPYTILYAAGVLLVAAPALAQAAPRIAFVLALVAPVGLVLAFPLWVTSLVVLTLMIPRARWPEARLVPTATRSSPLRATL
jgi:hypothetical protein